MPEIAGDAALLVDPYSVDEIRNGIEQLLSDSLLRAELIKKGKANILRFKPDHISDQYLAFYQSLT
jgi:glycosyltransferase involved in cell wall biosynthesis